MDTQLYHAAERIATEQPANAAWRADLYKWATERPADEPLGQAMRHGLMLVAALLLGAGLIFWIAANWPMLSNGVKLGLIQAALLAALAAASLLPRARNAALLCALLILGGLLAYIGQTYQTGADAWQLFAAWALLSMLWVVMARSEMLWTAWILIAALALALWTGPLGIMRLFVDGTKQGVTSTAMTMMTWLLLGLIPALVASLPWISPGRGSGRWSHRMALGLALAAWTFQGVASLFAFQGVAAAWLIAAFLVGAVLWLSMRGRWRDLTTLTLGLLAANVLAMALAARLLFSNSSDVGGLLLLGVLGLGCLGGSATWLLRQQQTWATEVRHEYTT